jgi:hypothetical protein
LIKKEIAAPLSPLPIEIYPKWKIRSTVEEVDGDRLKIPPNSNNPENSSILPEKFEYRNFLSLTIFRYQR